MIKKPEIPPLILGTLLALAACVLALLHTAIPTFIPYACLTLLGVSGGVTLPASAIVPASSLPAAPAARPTPIASA